MNDISKIRMAKNELNRSLNMDILRKNEPYLIKCPLCSASNMCTGFSSNKLASIR